LLLDMPAWESWAYWFATEAVNYTCILPVALTLPGWQWPRRARRHRPRRPLSVLAPVATLVAACAAGLIIGGPGAIAFPVPALLWCALAYSLLATAVLTLLFSTFSSLAIASGHLNLARDLSSGHALLSMRLGITLMSLAPITIASVMAAR